MEQFLFILRKQGFSPVILYDLVGHVISIQVIVQGTVYDLLEVYRDVVLGRMSLGELLVLRDDLVKEQEKQEVLVDRNVLRQLIRGSSAYYQDNEVRKAVQHAERLLEDM